MSYLVELDEIIASLANQLARISDTLLDLRDWARQPSRAGSCVKAYFAVLDEVPETIEVTALRKWMERHLSIYVYDGPQKIFLEKLPLKLDGATDLEGFCQSAMQRMHEDRCHGTSQIRMEFNYSGNCLEVAA